MVAGLVRHSAEAKTPHLPRRMRFRAVGRRPLQGRCIAIVRGLEALVSSVMSRAVLLHSLLSLFLFPLFFFFPLPDHPILTLICPQPGALSAMKQRETERENERDNSHLLLISFEISLDEYRSSRHPLDHLPRGSFEAMSNAARRGSSISRRPRRRRRRRAGSSTIFCAIVSAIFASPFLSTASRCKRKRRRRVHRSRDTPSVRSRAVRRGTASKRLLAAFIIISSSPPPSLSLFRKRKRDLAGG